MANRRHRSDTATFEELSFSDQAKSISAQILCLQKSIIAHLRRGAEENRNFQEIKLCCISQLARLIDRLSKLL